MRVATDERYAHLDDGCDAWLVDGARFDGVLGIPVIEAPEKVAVPSAVVPFSKRAKVSSPARYAVLDARSFPDPFKCVRIDCEEHSLYLSYLTCAVVRNVDGLETVGMTFGEFREAVFYCSDLFD